MGVDFLKLLNLQNIFYCIFLGSVSDIDTDFKCARVESIAIAGVPSNLRETLIENFSRTVTLTRDKENEDNRFVHTDGQVERQHQTILNYLTKFISENQKDWDQDSIISTGVQII